MLVPHMQPKWLLVNRDASPEGLAANENQRSLIAGNFADRVFLVEAMKLNYLLVSDGQEPFPTGFHLILLVFEPVRTKKLSRGSYNLKAPV